MSVKGLTREQRYLKSLFFFIYSFTLLKKTNKDVVGILEFDDRIIYEPIVQYLIMISMFEETLKSNMPMQESTYIS
ncbi:hypothetical protein [Holdemanella porci]|uniref:hypothetical protein n=1 Tax=Holdemanella porci TaxID=2652276 RepID=UPI003AB70B7F